MTDQITYLSDFLENAERQRGLQFGVMLRGKYQGKVYGYMNDGTNYTLGQAYEEAVTHDINDLLGIFSLDMNSGKITQIMNREQLVDYCEERAREEHNDEEKREQAQIDRHNNRHGTTL